MVTLVKKGAERYKKTLSAKEEEFVRKISYTSKVSFGPLCAFVGGLVCQESIKAITGKYTPISQIMYYNCQEVTPTLDAKDAEIVKKAVGLGIEDRYTGVRTLLGDGAFKKLANWKLFMVGVGAIGCDRF